mmetsp:Transcript_3096/g.11092  ORF Transcript_3096/g.11092 Transcript_3096/m.11092 type:complete len:174 (-) Transcript_3096:32-553(-)
MAHLFSRTVDTHLFFKALVEPLPREERFRFLNRLGLLNVLSCLTPETEYRLDLHFVDHWKVAHVLTQLATNEQGINFIETSFARTHEDPVIPGWDLPNSWDVYKYTGNLKAGVPKSGLLHVTYTGDGDDELRARLEKQFFLSGIQRPAFDAVSESCKVELAADRQKRQARLAV